MKSATTDGTRKGEIARSCASLLGLSNGDLVLGLYRHSRGGFMQVDEVNDRKESDAHIKSRSGLVDLEKSRKI